VENFSDVENSDCRLFMALENENKEGEYFIAQILMNCYFFVNSLHGEDKEG
jgi:hypothetical protein